MAEPVAHISGQRLQNRDQDADRSIKHKIDDQRREALRALPEVRYRHSRRHVGFLAFCLRISGNCRQFWDSESRRIRPSCEIWRESRRLAMQGSIFGVIFSSLEAILLK